MIEREREIEEVDNKMFVTKKRERGKDGVRVKT